MITSSERPTAALQEHNWSVLPEIIDPCLASELVDELLSGNPKQVTVGDGNEWWDQYSVQENGKIDQALTCDAVIKKINSFWGRTVRYTTRQWGQVYRVGQYIPWHTDGRGDIQLVLCLEPAPAGCGGALLLKTEEGEIALDLHVGDGLLFEATHVPHSTTPIIATAAVEQPRRVIAVSRFFIDV